MIFRRRQDEMEGFRRMREALRQQADPQDHALLDDDQYAPYEDDDDDQLALLDAEADDEATVVDAAPAPPLAAPDTTVEASATAEPVAEVEPVPMPEPVLPAAPAFVRPDGRAATVLGADASWSGTLRSDSDVHVEGRIEGTLEVRDTVYIAEHAAVSARVKARSVVVAGQFTGTVVCEGRLEVLPTGRVNGEVDVSSLIVHEGAIIDGKFRMRSPGAGQPR
jgi:cytoskeletal protein CcmA (bactofilin family)